MTQTISKELQLTLMRDAIHAGVPAMCITAVPTLVRFHVPLQRRLGAFVGVSACTVTRRFLTTKRPAVEVARRLSVTTRLEVRIVYVPGCAAEHEREQSRCCGTLPSQLSRHPWLGEVKSIGFAEQPVVHVQQWTCTDGAYGAVTGRVAAAFDRSHLTAAEDRELVPVLGREFDKFNVKGV